MLWYATVRNSNSAATKSAQLNKAPAVCESLSLSQWRGNPRQATRRRRRKVTPASLSLALPVKLGCCLCKASRVPLRPRTSASCTNARLLLPRFDGSNRFGVSLRRASERDFKFESLFLFGISEGESERAVSLRNKQERMQRPCINPSSRIVYVTSCFVTLQACP
jgi:hypothetical protein